MLVSSINTYLYIVSVFAGMLYVYMYVSSMNVSVWESHIRQDSRKL